MTTLKIAEFVPIPSVNTAAIANPGDFVNLRIEDHAAFALHVAFFKILRDRFGYNRRGSRLLGTKVSFETVRKLVLDLPSVELGTSYGKPALHAKGKMFACLPSHKSAEPDSLVVRIDFEQRAALLAEAPDLFYITDHYKNYPALLVRLSRVKPQMLKALLASAHRFVSHDSAPGRKIKRTRTSP